MTDWTERWPRPGWDLYFTQVGGRLRVDDPIEKLPKDKRATASRRASQVCIAVGQRGADRPNDPDIAFWSTVCRKILQRGVRPPVSPKVDSLLRARARPRDVSQAALLGALTGPAESFSLASSYELHPTWEEPFWRAVESLGPRATSWLVPQAPLEALAEKALSRDYSRRWVDLLYCPPGRKPVVLEIDGQGHERRQDADAARDRLLAAKGIDVLRAAGAAATDPNGKFLTLLRRHATHEQIADPDDDVLLAAHGPAVPGRFAVAVVEAVLRGFLPKGGPWSIEAVDALGLVDEVAGPSLDMLRAISEVWGLGIVPPFVRVNDRVWTLSGSSDVPLGDARQVRPTVRIRLEPFTPFFAELRETADIPEIVLRRVSVPAALGWLPSLSQERRSVSRAADINVHLRLLLLDLFGHEDSRDGQLASLRQTLAGGDAVVLLPTGSGKSLIYQLAGLLSPGTTLAVDPLISLIDDQERRLLQDGVDRVIALHSARAGGAEARDAALEEVATGRAHFVFLTPERFQSRRFRDHLRETAREQLINLAVIDEAHCVSEWGHDFRTSYLRLARNIRRLCEDRAGRKPPLLALTGTASPAVLRDALRELEIDPNQEGVLQRPKSHDRPNLRFLKETGPESDWMDLVIASIMDVVPRELGVSLEDLATPKGTETISGVVFSPHAGGRHGIDAIRTEIIRLFAKRNIKLDAEIYSGSAPTAAGGAGNWASQKALAAERFKNNEVPLLIGTKAFGMGIDKPNIRYTIHAGFPSSIEAFAQEAGRAGRNGALAACVLTASLPERELATHLLDPGLSSEKRAKLTETTSDTEGGDLRRQLYFLTKSFPGREEVRSAVDLYEKLLRAGGGPGCQVVISLAGTNLTEKQAAEEKKRIERGLYRLAMLGVVDDVTIDGTEATVAFAQYSQRSIDEAFLAYAARVEPGKELAHRESLDQAPAEINSRVSYHLNSLIRVVYRIVGRARLKALESMYYLAIGDRDPEALRRNINAYLGEGPSATILAEAVSMTPLNVQRFVAALDTLPPEDAYELDGATARQLEAYPDHPLLLFSGALATARIPDGTEERFSSLLERSLAQLIDYRVSAEEAAAAMIWLGGRLRSENQGRRWDWLPVIYRAWDSTRLPAILLEEMERDAFAIARRGLFNVYELTTVVGRRTRRHGSEVTRLADEYLSPPEDGKERGKDG